MNLSVHFTNERVARVVFAPSIIELVFLGKRHEERHVIRGIAGLWRYDCSGHLVERRVQRAIERAARQQGKPPSVAKATAPPNAGDERALN